MKHVLLMTSELATATAVSAALESNGKLSADDICRDVADLAVRLERSHSPAALIDIDGDPAATLAAMEPLARRFVDTRFVVLSAEMHHNVLLSAMQAGARHLLLKDAISSDLNRVLKQLCPDGSASRRGTAVTILSAGGGCGATTMAVNLAAELHQRSSESGAENGATEPEGPALIVDLDAHYGAVSAYLGLEGQYSLSDILSRTGAIDVELIQSTSLSHSEALSALNSASRQRLGEPFNFEPHQLGQAIEACKMAYRWTVIDAPRIGTAAAAELARHSAVTFLLLQLTVKDIRSARQMLDAIHDQGVSRASIRVLATRYRKRRMLIDPEEARRALGLAGDQRLEILSNDYYPVTEAVNLGKPLAQVAPRSDFRRELQKLAASIPMIQPISAPKVDGPAPVRSMAAARSY